MIDRPTQEQVDAALRYAEQWSFRGIDRADPIDNADVLLAAEVRALQEELEAARGAVLYHASLELKNQLKITRAAIDNLERVNAKLRVENEEIKRRWDADMNALSLAKLKLTNARVRLECERCGWRSP